MKKLFVIIFVLYATFVVAGEIGKNVYVVKDASLEKREIYGRVVEEPGSHTLKGHIEFHDFYGKKEKITVEGSWRGKGIMYLVGENGKLYRMEVIENE